MTYTPEEPRCVCGHVLDHHDKRGRHCRVWICHCDSYRSPWAKRPKFPLGAAVKRGYCDGVFCFTKREEELVAAVRVGAGLAKSWDMELCAGCLADFVKAGIMLTNVRIFVLALDSLYHEVQGDVLDTVKDALG